MIALPPRIELRENQEETVQRILSLYAGGTRTVFLDAPVGSGKSLIHLLVARSLGSAYATTPQTMLVDQYGRDTAPGAKFAGMASTLYGRANYECPYVRSLPLGDPEATADGAPCTYLDGWPADCPAFSQCPYYRAKAAAQAAPSSVTTLAYLFVGVLKGIDRPNSGWGPRSLLVVDEAHGLPEDLVQFFSCEVGEKTLPGFDFAGIGGADDPLEFMRERLPGYAREQAETLEAMQADPSNLKAMGRQARLVRRAQRLEENLARDDVEWVHTCGDRPPKHLWRPLSAGPLVGADWRRFDHVLLSSATFFGIPTLVRDLGLPGPWEVVTVPDTFPPGNAPVRLTGTVRLNKERMAAELPTVVTELARIAHLHPSERGIIHCNSYMVREFIEANAPRPFSSRLVFHDRGDRNESLEEWKDDGRRNSVFVGVAMSEGLDLVGDQARWQVVIKAPFPNLGDPWVVRRRDRPGGRQWYEEQAITDMLQACGRVMRSRDDRGATYILDANADRLLRRYWASLPGWFRARVGAGAIS